MSTDQRTSWPLWVVMIAMAVLATLFVAVPIRCPDCEGSGIELIRSHSRHGRCPRCSGAGELSLLRKWTTKSQETYVGDVNSRDIPQVRALLAVEGIPVIPGSIMFDIVEIDTDSPPHARRARELIEWDARIRGYTFYSPNHHTTSVEK